MRETPSDASRALERFLTGVERRAFRMAQIATSSREDALDIVQDAMMLLAQRYAQRDAGEWEPLFFRILQNRIRDWYRRQKVRARWRAWLGRDDDEQDNPLESIPDPRARDPAADHAGERLMGQIEAALRSLPLRQQQVFLLRAWEGFDVAQTAQALAIGEGSVKTHYSRAVHRLRELLGEHWP